MSNISNTQERREIWHEIHLDASLREVYQAVADVKGLAHWWTTDVCRESVVGNKLEFWFNAQFAAEMQVTELQQDSLIRWQVTDRSMTEWIGTEISFEIFRRGKKTILHLRHSNWLASAVMFPECSMHGALYLLSLKEYVETGRGRPHPYDIPVNI